MEKIKLNTKLLFNFSTSFAWGPVSVLRVRFGKKKLNNLFGHNLRIFQIMIYNKCLPGF